MEDIEKKYEKSIHYNVEMNEIRFEYKDHPPINSVTHKFRGTVSWEKALEQVIINYRRRHGLID